jgi:hypothetical protein
MQWHETDFLQSLVRNVEDLLTKQDVAKKNNVYIRSVIAEKGTTEGWKVMTTGLEFCPSQWDNLKVSDKLTLRIGMLCAKLWFRNV